MLIKGNHYVLMDEKSGDSGGGSGAGSAVGAGQGADGGAGGNAGGTAQSGGAGNSDAGRSEAGASAAGAGRGDGTKGAAGKTGAGSVLEAGGGEPAIPEKFHVKKEDGSLDIEASALKLAENYTKLEKRMGTGDAPPKTVADYKVEIPEGMKDYDIEKDTAFTEFRDKAHKAGMTQAQFDLVMGEYFRVAPELVGGAKALDEETCANELRTTWKSDAQFKAEVGNAYKALQSYGGDDADGLMKDYGNDPRVVRMLARVGAELGEDKSPSSGGSLPAGQTVEAMMQSEAYTNAKHADHARVSALVTAEFNRRSTAAARAGKSPVM